MSKIKRIILFLVITIFVLGFNLCYAVDLNMTNDDDLLDDIDSVSNTYNESSDDSRLGTENTTTNSIDDEDEDEYIYDDSSVSDNSNDGSNIPSTTVTNVSSSGLELTNILNILLIVIGVLLILLSIAILIRLKK